MEQKKRNHNAKDFSSTLYRYTSKNTNYGAIL